MQIYKKNTIFLHKIKKYYYFCIKFNIKYTLQYENAP